MKSKNRRAVVNLMIALPILSGISKLAKAQDQPPPPPCPGPGCPNGKTTRIIVPYPPGGSTDTVARTLIEALQKSSSRSYVIENIGGAGGVVGASRMAAEQDVDTILIASSSLIAASSTTKYSFDPTTQLQPVARIASDPIVLVVLTQDAAKSYSEFEKNAKSSGPGKMSIALPGAGTASHLALLEMEEKTRVNLTSIPYKGSGPALTDLLGGQVNAALLSFSSARSQVQAGKIKILAVFAGKDEQIAATSQTGLRRFDTSNWIAAFVSTKLSQTDAKRFGDYIAGVAATKSFATALFNKGIASADPLGPEAFKAQVNAEYAATRAAFAKAGIKLD